MQDETGSENIFIGRQPIFNRELKLYGYELLFRSSEQGFANIDDADQATAQVMINAFTEFGLNHVVGDNPAFINMTRDFLTGKNPLPLEPDRVVLEILETTTVDDELISGVSKLVDQGFIIALDDFVYSSEWDPLLEMAGIIKIEVPALNEEELWNHAVKLRRYNAKLLAEKVETEEEFENLRQMGYDLFQGYFLAKPKVLRGTRIPTNKLTILQLVLELQDKNTDVDRLEQIISRDVTMSYRILRYINSAYCALSRKVESIHEAIVYVGTGNISRWASLIAMTGFNDRPEELLRMAMMRARMCERMANAAGCADTGSYFTVGLFSVLDALLRQPMSSIVSELPFSEEMKAALLYKQGRIGEALQCAESCEQVICEPSGFGSLDRVQLRDIYLEAMVWSNDNTRQFLK
jgi:EAL and modified HD-GYP domain-containing signal transduction protein